MYLLCWSDCQGARDSGFGIGVMRREAIVDWCVYNELTRDETEDTVFIVLKMDLAYLEYERSKQET